MSQTGLNIIDLGFENPVVVIDCSKFHRVRPWEDILQCLHKEVFSQYKTSCWKELESVNSDHYHKFRQCFLK